MAEQNNTFFDRLEKIFRKGILLKGQEYAKIRNFDIDKIQSKLKLDTNIVNADTTSGFLKSSYADNILMHGIQVTRKNLYMDYEAMDADARLSSALDIYSDEASTRNEFGEIIHIDTEDENIKNALENLFYDILNIEFNLWPWVRILVKYGDLFLKLDITEKIGITNAYPLSCYAIQRLDGDNGDVSFKYDPSLSLQMAPSYKIKTFQDYEIVHFRLLSDFNLIPYGKSILENGRRTWKRITLLEDAMLLARIMRAPERRVIKVDVGNIPPNEVAAHMNLVINNMKKVPYMDPETGEYNMRFNLMPIAWYSIIPLLDGREITIKELSEEYEQGKINYVYSIDKNDNNKIVPGKVEWCGLTIKEADIIRITLDDSSYLDVEPSHPVMLRNGDYKMAKDLKEEESIMPFYTTLSTQKNIADYELIFNPKTEKYEYTHRLVASALNLNEYNANKNVVHHKDFKKLNNSPDNLDCSMTSSEHIRYHRNNTMWNNKSQEELNIINEKRKATLKEMFSSGELKIWSKGKTKETDIRLKKLGEKISGVVSEQFKNGRVATFQDKKRPEHSKWMKENMIPYIRTEETIKKLSDSKKGKKSKFENKLKGKSYEEVFGIEKANEIKNKIKLTLKLNPMSKEERLKKRNFMKQENKRRWEDKNYKEKVTNAMKDKFDDYLFNTIKIIVSENENMTIRKICDEMNNINGLYEYYLKLNAGRKKPKEFMMHTIKRAIRERGYINVDEFMKKVSTSKINHKIKKIELLTKKEDVYCMTVAEYHNFATITHEGESRNGIFVKNSSLEDFFLPVRGDKSGTEFDTLPGMEFTGLEDIQYEMNNLLASLKIPKSFLTFEESMNAKSNLASEDVRFSRSIERVQRVVETELTKLALIHLYSQGFTDEQLTQFELKLTTSSKLAEQERVELWTSKLELAKSFIEARLVPMEWIYTELFNMTEDDYKKWQEKDIPEDLKRMFRYNQIAEEGNDPAVTKETSNTKTDEDTWSESKLKKSDTAEDLDTKKQRLIKATFEQFDKNKEKSNKRLVERKKQYRKEMIKRMKNTNLLNEKNILTEEEIIHKIDTVKKSL